MYLSLYDITRHVQERGNKIAYLAPTVRLSNNIWYDQNKVEMTNLLINGAQNERTFQIEILDSDTHNKENLKKFENFLNK